MCPAKKMLSQIPHIGRKVLLGACGLRAATKQNAVLGLDSKSGAIDQQRTGSHDPRKQVQQTAIFTVDWATF